MSMYGLYFLILRIYVVTSEHKNVSLYEAVFKIAKSQQYKMCANHTQLHARMFLV